MPARRPRLAGPAIALLVTVLVACTDDDGASSTSVRPATTTSTTEPARTDDGVLTIGLLLPQSGDGAAIGQGMVDAGMRARDEINGAGGVLDHAVEMISADEGSDPSSATDGINKLLDEGVDAVVGPASSTVALATLDDLLSAGVLTCSPTATSLALDEYPYSRLFFRTAPSDSLQAEAIAELAQQTGRSRVAVVFLDDYYGHPLSEAVDAALSGRALDIVAQIPFRSDEDNLLDEATKLADSQAEVVVVLGDGEHAWRMLSAIGETSGSFPDVEPPDIIVNDAVRRAPSPQLVQQLPTAIRERIQGVSPLAFPQFEDEPSGPFATNAYDCVNLIALSAVQAGTDDPEQIAARMTEASSTGQPCRDFKSCVELLEDARNIDYDGPAGNVQIGSEGETERARFDVFRFDENGRDVSTGRTLIP